MPKSNTCFKTDQYFPDSEIYDDIQKKKALLKYNMVNLLHLLFLLFVMLIMLWPLLHFPTRTEIFEYCIQSKMTINPANQKWKVAEVEKAWYPFQQWTKVYIHLDHLKQWYNCDNETALFNKTSNDSVIYKLYVASAVDAAQAVILPAMNSVY